ncbi:ABC transporter ATP-binding protein [Paenibacillus daejeonensis]|uniref:ABC transporter ATP-binding protein n=1 Tax=Paenibacillus daejeonensis TaxID=135193 RepID=UPI00037378A9|nr:ABC transporter ATP-binding protein [Paenibacillus daejeonensis]
MKLVIDHVSRSYKRHLAIDDVSCELTPGIYGLIGPNGAGKTTLMRMLADVLRPSSGQITVNGTSTAVLGERYRDLLGYLPQEVGFYSYFTGERFMRYIASLKGLPGRESEARITALLRLVQLEDQRHRKIGHYSGGMKRRLGIAQALLNDPKLLILDEPTAGLDPKERIRLRNLLSDISGERIVILSTHIITDIEFIAKEVLILKDGRLVRQDPPEQILHELEGKVWSVQIPAHRLHELEKQYMVGNIQRRGDEALARIIADRRPEGEATALEPRLEDIYLYYFGDQPERDE